MTDAVEQALLEEDREQLGDPVKSARKWTQRAELHEAEAEKEAQWAMSKIRRFIHTNDAALLADAGDDLVRARGHMRDAQRLRRQAGQERLVDD